MAKVKDHLFDFTGEVIAKACEQGQAYHDGRVIYWTKVQEQQIERGKNLTVVVKQRTQHYTGGKSVEFYADLVGIQDINDRLRFAAQKIDTHRAAAEQFKLKGAAYATQPYREYELDPDDVAYFKLNGAERDE